MPMLTRDIPRITIKMEYWDIGGDQDKVETIIMPEGTVINHIKLAQLNAPDFAASCIVTRTEPGIVQTIELEPDQLADIATTETVFV